MQYLFNYKYIIIFIIFIMILIFKNNLFSKNIFRKKKVTFNEKNNEILEISKNDYIKSNTFKGMKRNYVFKTDYLGTGYYLDTL